MKMKYRVVGTITIDVKEFNEGMPTIVKLLKSVGVYVKRATLLNFDEIKKELKK